MLLAPPPGDGPETKAAVIKMQEAHFDEILKPLGLTKGTGIFHEFSLAFANKTIDAEGGKI